MTIQITHEIEQLARLVASKTGQTRDDIIKEAVEARALAAGVSVARPRRTAMEIEQRLKQVAERVAALPILDDRSADDIIGYNASGVPE